MSINGLCKTTVLCSLPSHLSLLRLTANAMYHFPVTVSLSYYLTDWEEGASAKELSQQTGLWVRLGDIFLIAN